MDLKLAVTASGAEMTVVQWQKGIPVPSPRSLL
jgi:hypothetical protein